MRTRRWSSLLGIVLLAAACAREPEDLAGLAHAGREALKRGGVQRAATLLERAVVLAPENPNLLYVCARAESLAGDRDRALQHLARTVDLGFGDGAAREPAFRSLAPLPGFQGLLRRIARQGSPVDPSRPAFVLPSDLIPEGMAWDAAGRAFYVGSLLRHKIARIGPDGVARDFVPSGAGGLGEVLGMKVDATRRELVAAAMGLGPRRRGSGLFRFDLATGRPTGSVVLDGHDRQHLWNDLAFLPDGGLVVTDSEEGTVYRVRNGRAERLLAPGSLLYPNGIATTPDGRRAFVAHGEGIAILDLATRRLAPLPHPDGVAILGIDGHYLDLQPAGGRLIGVQNDTDPIRLIALPLDATLTRVTGLTILAARTPNLPLPTTGALVGGDFYYMANTQTDQLSDDGRLLVPLEKLQPVMVRVMRLP